MTVMVHVGFRGALDSHTTAVTYSRNGEFYVATLTREVIVTKPIFKTEGQGFKAGSERETPQRAETGEEKEGLSISFRHDGQQAG